MSKPTTISIDNVEYVRKDSIKPQILPIPDTPIGRYCIIRCRAAGVWCGVVAAAKDRSCTLVGARRLWYWKAAKGHTLSAVANYGLSESKMPAPVAEVFLTEVCELIPVTETAQKNLEAQPNHNEK